MGKGVIGVFDDVRVAARARDELLGAAFGDDDVMLHFNDANASAGGPDDEGASARPGASVLGEIFSSLFDLDGSDQPTGRLSGAFRRGSFLVIVKADDDARARDAGAILDRCGALETIELS